MIFDNFDVDGEPQVLEICPLMGGYFHVYINRRFVTSISYTTQGWRVHFNNNSWLSRDEADIFIEMIESGEIPTL
jgi:predicted Zn-dependent protease